MRVSVFIRWASVFWLAAASWSVARVVVEVCGEPAELRENVRLHVGEPANDDPQVVRRHAAGAADRARDALRALGYYQATIEVLPRREDTNFFLKVQFEPGEPVRLGNVKISIWGEAATDSDFLEWEKSVPLQSGDVLHHGHYEDTKRALANLALDRGYFDGHYTESAIRIHPSKNRADVILRFKSGKRYRLGAVRMTPVALSSSLLQRHVPFKEGDFYSAENIAALHLNLSRSAYFDEVRILPRPEEADENGILPVDAKLTLAPPNRIGIGVGAATDVGARVRLDWARPWLNRRGHSALVQTEASFVRQEVSAQYSIPLNPPLDHQLQFTTGWEAENIEDTDRETVEVGIRRRRLYPNGWQSVLSLRWEREDFEQAEVRDVTSLTLPAIQLSRTRKTGGIYPTRGDRLSALLETAHPDLFSDIRLTRVLLQAKRLDSIGAHRLLGRIEFGALDTSDFDRTPPSLRFFAGGDQSVRGFGYQSLAPRDEKDELVGGRFLLTGSLEYNYEFLRHWRMAVFYDIGNAFAESHFQEKFAQGTGFGVRWLSPLAPLKLDFAWGVSESNPPFRVHFSMGTDL